ncbi:hypothetical protein CSOJ01_00313 [Colletotrichum sojae]|uniref:Uncharacterized protein n=1 Tax=Colletotrichum sojae TaxID=2175907 RepID=A0A8H6JXJ1_9PEZI|nr:hypothetical protein CSOJ01_00313 [Colletotrichum sojae]
MAWPMGPVWAVEESGQSVFCGLGTDAKRHRRCCQPVVIALRGPGCFRCLGWTGGAVKRLNFPLLLLVPAICFEVQVATGCAPLGRRSLPGTFSAENLSESMSPITEDMIQNAMLLRTMYKQDMGVGRTSAGYVPRINPAPQLSHLQQVRSHTKQAASTVCLSLFLPGLLTLFN